MAALAPGLLRTFSADTGRAEDLQVPREPLR
jgi:hypothetical protein